MGFISADVSEEVSSGRVADHFVAIQIKHPGFVTMNILYLCYFFLFQIS